MGQIVVCRQLPCALHPVLWVHHLVVQVHDSASRIDRATPFLIGICLLVITAGTTKLVIDKAERHIREEWKPVDETNEQNIHILPLNWVVDVAQIPVLLGTPLVGLFILQHQINALSYTAVMTGGIVAFVIVLSVKQINDYGRFDFKIGRIRVGIITAGGIFVNLVCAVIAYSLE
jgi:hypothetical protein